MNNVSKQIILLLFTLSALNSNGQGYITDYKSAGIGFTVTNYHSNLLDNRENISNYLSYDVNASYNFALSRIFNFNQLIGIGTLQNASKYEQFWQNTLKINYNAGLSLNIFKFFKRNYEGKFVPYGAVNYQLNYFDKTAFSRPKQLLSQFNYGGGISYQINDNLGVYTQFQLGQRIGADFKSSFNTQFGLLAILE